MRIYYTDGSASPNPGPGGFAVVSDGKPVVLGGEPSGAETTNIRMEGYAIMAALKHAGGEPCQIHTDSEFWINVITKWSLGWEAKGCQPSRTRLGARPRGPRRQRTSRLLGEPGPRRSKSIVMAYDAGLRSG